MSKGQATNPRKTWHQNVNAMGRCKKTTTSTLLGKCVGCLLQSESWRQWWLAHIVRTMRP
eukprot:2171355-Amphidinium_carterae.1